MLQKYYLYNQPLSELKNTTLLISTLNAHSYNVSRVDSDFREVLQKSNILIPDGISVVWAQNWLFGERLSKIAGADLFFYEMERLQTDGGTAFFLGSTENTLTKIRVRITKEYPSVNVHTYSPPYKHEFSKEDNQNMFERINKAKPDVLFIGMTAPKQEKWAYQAMNDEQLILNRCHVCCIGAVFDFYAGTVKRAPQWMIKIGLEWLFRLIKEPKRMWRRYLLGNCKFIGYMIQEKFSSL